MMLLRPAVVFAVLALFTACKEEATKTQTVAAPPPEPPELSSVLTGAWPAAGTETVTGYRFRTPDGEGGGSYSLLVGGQVDLGTLKKTTVASAELKPEQVKKLLGCIFGERPSSGPAACYGPHHLFLFRDGEGKITHAIEVCFGCKNVATNPALTEEQWNRHDLRGLARLCDEIGIRMTEGTAEEFVRFLDENEK